MVKKMDLIITDENAIIQSHSIYGQNLMPGLGYIDLIYQMGMILKIKYDKYCIQNLTIANPLIVMKEKQIELNITFEQKGDIWFVEIKGEKQLYAKAEMHLENKMYTEKIDREQEKEKAEELLTMDSVYESARQHELIHSGIMKVDGKCYLANSHLYMEIMVGKGYTDSSKEYLFHPALIDGAGMAGGAIRGDSEDTKNLYVPLCYEYFYCTEKITEKCYARVKKSSVREKNEIRSSDMDFFNEAGYQIGELCGVTSKKIRQKGQISTTKNHYMNPKAENQFIKQQEVKTEYDDNRQRQEIEDKLATIFAKYLKLDPQQINKKIGFFEMGLESVQLLSVHQDIENYMDIKLNQIVLFEYSTISELAEHIEKVSYEKNSSEQISEIIMDIENEKIGQEQNAQDEDVAVIGIAGYFPEANNVEEFWKNLLEGKDCIKEVPKTRWDWHDYEDVQTPSGKPISRWGGFIDDVAGFDAEFFRISPREAEIIDPQERLFLQCCWKTLEDAGYTPENVCSQKERKVGVYVGVMHKDYSLIGLDVLNNGRYVPLSLNYAPIANRVSYFCNFHGPSMALDTVCSSSLLSIHLAVESIQKGESEVALAGGVNLSLHPAKYISYGLAGMHSSHGRCNTFGIDADGYVSSDGIGAVLLKPLSKAIEDKDNIYAVIKKTTVNHGGSASGLTVPNPAAQGALIDDCLRKARINPRSISYMEAHGTGTSLGDPIEIQGLTNAFAKYTTDKQYCSIGSVKTNIGHAESASGIVGFIKVCLQLYYQTLVPSLHSEELNKILKFQDSPFYVQHKTEHWKHSIIQTSDGLIECKRRAAISAFGATGTNVHAIVEEYEPEEVPKSKLNNKVCIILSAKNEERLFEYISEFVGFLEKQDKEEFSLEEMAYTLQVGRVELDERLVVIASDLDELKDKLQKILIHEKNIQSVFRDNLRKADNVIKQLMTNEEWNELVKKWIQEGDLERIAKLWIAGISINWKEIYRENLPYRMSLPTYPFAHTKYWLKPNIDEIVTSEKKDVKREILQLDNKISKRSLFDIYKKKDMIQKPNLIQDNDSDMGMVEACLITWLSNELNVSKENVDLEVDIQELGLEQINIVRIVEKIYEKFNVKVEIFNLFEEKTVRNIAQFIKKKM